MRRLGALIIAAILAFVAGPAHALTATSYIQGQGATNWHVLYNSFISDTSSEVNALTLGTTSLTWIVGTGSSDDGRPQLQVDDPGYSFAGDTDTGFGRYGANQPGVYGGGAWFCYWASDGDLSLNAHNIDNLAQINGTTGVFSGNVEAGSLTIGGLAVSSVVDSIWSSAGSGHYQYFGGEIRTMYDRLYDSTQSYNYYTWVSTSGTPWERVSGHYSQPRALASHTYGDYGGAVSKIASLSSGAGVFVYRTDLDPDKGDWRLSVKNSSGVVFPKVAIISLSNASATARVVVRDASTNEVWASYDSGSDYWLTMSSYTTANLNSISAAHGQIWIGSKTPAGAEYVLFFADFILGECGYQTASSVRLHDGGLTNANSASGQTVFPASARGNILAPTCNDVDVKVINGRMTVAVATDSGVSIGTASGSDPRVIDTWVDITNGALPYSRNVELTDIGGLYAGFGDATATHRLYYFRAIPTTDALASTADYYLALTKPGPYYLPVSNYFSGAAVLKGRSLSFAGNDAVAIASGVSGYAGGVGLWHSNSSNQDEGAGQKWRTDYTVPPLFGTPMGCWTLEEAPTGSVSDKLVSGDANRLDLTAVGMSAGNQSAVASGADLQAYTFSDANDWLQEAIFYDENNSGASWSTENWSDGSASATIVDADTNLEIYETTSGDSGFILVATDGTNLAWGYIRGITTGSPYTITINNSVGGGTANWNGAPGSMGAVTKWWIFKAAPSAYTGSLTFSIWVRAPSSFSGTIAGRRYNADVSQSSFYVYLASGVPQFGVSASSTDYQTSTSGVPSIADNQWHQLTGVFESSTRVTLYIDGVQVSENTSSIPSAFNESWIPLILNGLYDKDGHLGGNTWSLAIPSIVKMALSDEQVTGLYRSTQAWFQEDAKILIGSNTVYGVTYDEQLGRLYAATAAGVYGIDIATGTIVEVLDTSDSDSDGTAISSNTMSYAHAAGGVLAWLNAAQLGVWMVQPVKVDESIYADSNGALHAQAKHGNSIVSEQVVPAGFIKGLAYTHTSDTTFTIKPGQVEVNGVIARLSSDLVVDAEEAVGSALSNSTWYWFGFQDKDGDGVIESGEIVVTSTGPTSYVSTKGGFYLDANTRALGCWRTDSSGDIGDIVCDGSWVHIKWDLVILDTSSPATTQTLISVGAPTAIEGELLVYLRAALTHPATAPAALWIGTLSSITIAPVAGMYAVAQIQHFTNEDGEVPYQATVAGSTVSIWLGGFKFPSGLAR